MKPMTFEEWIEHCGFQWSGVAERDWYDSARIGMIPEDEAIRIPPEKEWPDWAIGIEINFTQQDSIVSRHSARYQKIMYIPRSKPSWVPKVGEAVFITFNRGRSHYVGLYKGTVTSTSTAWGVLLTGSGFETSFENLKPFNRAYIGKPWSEIPEVANE